MNIRSMILVLAFLVLSIVGYFYFITSTNNIFIVPKFHSPPIFSAAYKEANNGTTVTVNDWIMQMEQKYQMLNERIRSVCQKYREKEGAESFLQVKYVGENILENTELDANNKLAYCGNAKVLSISVTKKCIGLSSSASTN